jgi:uncharacterized protein YbjT (DUF2867 family)
MKIIVIGATGTIGSEVVKALSLNKHEIVRASRSGDVKVNLDDAASIRTMSITRAGIVTLAKNRRFLRPFATTSSSLNR